jgi:hypothetical protein
MRSRSLLATAAATAALTLVPLAAQAASQRPAELIDRFAYDAVADQTPGSFHIANATNGELGGYLDLLVEANDGSLPTGPNACEPAIVTTVLTVSPGEVLSSRTRGDLCTGPFGDSMTVNSTVRTRNLSYSGTAHHKPKIVGDGLIAAGVFAPGYGQATFSASIRW